MVSALDDVLDAIARAASPDLPGSVRVGDVTLTAPQSHAVHAAERALREFGGALLADPPGSGKTFVALAVARRRGAAAVLAPASLRAQWLAAAERAGVRIAFLSLERVSRGRSPPPAPLVIVDEAHRVANPRAVRYRLVAAAAHRAPVLLLTATPVRNRPAERTALLSLFLGAEAAGVDDALLARCIIRHSGGIHPAPRVEKHPPIAIRAARGVRALLARLPAPLALEGQDARALVVTGLARAWCSSVAALDRALVHRLQRGAAIVSMLDAGTRPSRDDLRAWALGEGAMQMAFSFGVTGDADLAGARDLSEARDLIERHLRAVQEVRNRTRRAARRDAAARASAIAALLEQHAGEIVVAFTCFETTARAVFSALRHLAGVVVMTGCGARSAAGPLDRGHLLTRLDAARRTLPSRDALMRLRLVISTDLLSEGVNLHAASVIVHLDEPWTPAGLEQRLGRAARMGAHHAVVHEYRFARPAALASLVSMERIHRRKRVAATRAVAPGAHADELRRVTARWRRTSAAPVAGWRIVAAARSTRDGFVGVVASGSRSMLVTGSRRRDAWTVTSDPARVCAALRHVGAEVAAPSRGEVAAAGAAIRAWAARAEARALSGLGRVPSRDERRLLSRLATMVGRAPPSRQPTLYRRAERIRLGIAARGGIGRARVLAELLEADCGDAEWVERCERELGGPAVSRDAPDVEVSAILFLAGPAATAGAAPAPLPSPPASWPGTAAPR